MKDTWAPGSTETNALGSRASEGAPNIVVIVLDDTGFAQLGAYGSDIATPAIDSLASGGLRFNRFHTTSLCSPTRASLLTGRNHHAVGMGFLVDVPLNLPGYNARPPASAAPLPRILKDFGYNTLAVGKWHLTPRGERTQAGPYDRWPLGYGFERFYGFLQGDTNHWAPHLVADNHYIEPPARPDEGYHLSEDLADQAIRMVADQQHAAPEKPFFLYFALGATHAPHQVGEQWIAPYAGQFDQGWDRWREKVFARQEEDGIVPPGTLLTERPPWVTPWDEMPEDERRMHARQQEVFAGFLTHADAQIGRLVSYLGTTAKSDNTLILLLSDNGASAEGGRFGSFNEHRFTSRLTETVHDNLNVLGEWGGFRSYSHYSWGWAWAGNTPLRLWKRYTWLGGTRTPLIIKWPRGIHAKGQVREQFCHANDLMPTILSACGLDQPKFVAGVPQAPFDGASILPTFDGPHASTRSTQYFEMLGSRSIVHDGWKATTDHVSQGVLDEEELMTGSRDFDADHWALFKPDDFSESADVSAEFPDVVQTVREIWWEEAAKNDVLPMSEGLTSRLGSIIPPEYPPSQRRTFYPLSPVLDESLPYLAGGFTIEVDAEVSAAGGEGILCALGDWNGGFALYVRGGRLVFAYRPGGQLAITRSETMVPVANHVLGVRCRPGPRAVQFTLTCDGNAIGSSSAEVAMTFSFQNGGTFLRLGHDSGFPVIDEYDPPFEWTGRIKHVVVDASPQPRPSAAAARDALRSD